MNNSNNPIKEFKTWFDQLPSAKANKNKKNITKNNEYISEGYRKYLENYERTNNECN